MIENELKNARQASYALLDLSEEQINAVLRQLADALEANSEQIVSANALDLSKMNPEDSRYDRLLLNSERIAGIASDTRNVAALPSPLNRTLSESVRPNGMKIRKVSVPFGVIGVIYEARPNVTIDVFSLCFKAGSAVLLKGGKEAAESNATLVNTIHNVLSANGLPASLCTLLPNDHEATTEMLCAVGQVDLVIPRGSRRLIDYVRDNARVPVIETGAGICHTYIDRDADVAMASAIVNNGKTRRISVCNALDCVVIHQDRLSDLPEICKPMASADDPAKRVIIYADERAYAALDGKYPANLLEHAQPEHFGMEFQAYKLAIRTVDTFDEAVEYVQTHTSHHSESIVSRDEKACQRFLRLIDAACVYQNLPTSWTDGAQFGFGAEIGISTQKLHARGPMALPEITTYKYQVIGEGQIRK
ncbi:MAG: glutamate-5-semialdehyde dehydrogenase [Bacteroidales bacterium]|jgi:glutamate-5-semialdehyde dehydrogenase|nr:glutamate-5-semialdehyde dehydrogenase [Bacteroidales bacterium]